MKKVLALVLSVVMVLAMGMTAFAAGSPGTISKDVEGSSDKGKVEIKVVDPYFVGTADKKAETINKDANVLAVVDVEFVGPFPAGGANIRLNVADVKKGDNIMLLHWVEKYDEKTGEYSGSWEEIRPYEVGDGYVIAYFSSLSPVAVVKLPAGAGAAATTGTSPITGYWG